MHLNHPETILPTRPSMEKLSSMKSVSDAKKARDFWPSGLCQFRLFDSKCLNWGLKIYISKKPSNATGKKKKQLHFENNCTNSYMIMWRNE